MFLLCYSFNATGWSIKLIPSPTTPTSIIGNDKICVGYPYTYTATVADPNTMFIWEVWENSALVSSFTGNSVNVIWTTTGTKQLKVFKESLDLEGCISAPYTLNVTNDVPAANITGVNSTCADSKTNHSISYTNGEAYFWKLSNPALGSVSAGQGTTNIEVTWNHFTATTNVQLICEITKCGQVHVFHKTITIYTSPVFSLTANPDPVCEGFPVAFTLTSTPAANITNILWDYADGSTQNNTLLNVTHSYTIPGNVPVTKAVTATVTHTGCFAGPNTFTNTVNLSAPLTVNPTPEIKISPAGKTFICNNNTTPQSGTITLSNNNTPGGTIEWYQQQGSTVTPLTMYNGFTAIPFSVSTGPTYVNTSYYATVTNSYGCIAESNKFTIAYIPCSSGVCVPVGPAGWTSNPPAMTYTQNCNIGGNKNATVTPSATQPLGTIGSNIYYNYWKVIATPASGLVSPLGTPSLPQHSYIMLRPYIHLTDPAIIHLSMA